MAAGKTHLKRDCFDPCKRESGGDSVHPLVFPVFSAQQAAQLGPRCGNHVTESLGSGREEADGWAAPRSVLQQDKCMLRSV